MGKKKRPAIITFIAILDIITGAVGLAVASLWLPLVDWLATLDTTVAQYITWIQGLGTALLGIGGVISVIVGYSLLKGKSWAYYLTLFGYGLGLMTFFAPGGIVGAMVSILMMALLLRRDAQDYCKTKIGVAWG